MHCTPNRSCTWVVHFGQVVSTHFQDWFEEQGWKWVLVSKATTGKLTDLDDTSVLSWTSGWRKRPLGSAVHVRSLMLFRWMRCFSFCHSFCQRNFLSSILRIASCVVAPTIIEKSIDLTLPTYRKIMYPILVIYYFKSGIKTLFSKKVNKCGPR